MKVLNNMSNKIKGSIARTGLKISKRSPEILMVVGAVTFVGTVIVACKQTLKCEEVLDEHQRKMDEIENCLEITAERLETEEEVTEPEYTEKDAKKDKAIAFAQTGWEFAKIYAPAVLLGAVSITCFGCSFHIMKKRNLALTVAYGALDKAFKEYRSRVKEQLGEESDRYFRYGYKKVKSGLIEGVNEKTGEVEAVKGKDLDTVPWDEDGDHTLDEARFVFAPETSKYWGVDEIHNDMTISSVLNVAKVNYGMKGYMFLNEVLRELGLKEVPYGQLVGWVKGIGDDYLDFGVKKVYRKASSDPNRNPLGLEYECIYEFDFNTCGIIWDKI